MARSGINLDLTQLAIIFGGLGIAYYMYVSDLPPFNLLPKVPDFRSQAEDKALEDVEEVDPNDPFPDKEGIAFDFNKKGGTSGDLENDFFRVLQRQSDLLGLGPGFQGTPRVVGDAEIPTAGTQLPGAGSFGIGGFGPVVFDVNGNAIVIPATTQGISPGACTSTCQLKCDQLYPSITQPQLNSVCKSSCGTICSQIVQSSMARARHSTRSKSSHMDVFRANEAMKLKKDTVESEQMNALREKKKRTNVVGIHVNDPTNVNFQGIVSSGMRLRPILLASRSQDRYMSNRASNV